MKYCEGCQFSDGVVMVRVGMRTEAMPACNLDDDLFDEFYGLNNFFGEYFRQTSHEGKGQSSPVVNHYGTAVKVSECIGSGVSE